MSQRVRVRRPSEEEGRSLQRIVRRGGGKTMVSVVRCRRAMVVLASAGGNTVEVIARLVATSPDRVREMIHRFIEMGMASLDPMWAGGRPRRITTDDEEFIVETAKKRPAQVGAPFSHWSLRKLRRWLGENTDRPIMISRERLRQILDRHEVSFQRTKTWKESNDPLTEPQGLEPGVGAEVPTCSDQAMKVVVDGELGHLVARQAVVEDAAVVDRLRGVLQQVPGQALAAVESDDVDLVAGPPADGRAAGNRVGNGDLAHGGDDRGGEHGRIAGWLGLSDWIEPEQGVDVDQPAGLILDHFDVGEPVGLVEGSDRGTEEAGQVVMGGDGGAPTQLGDPVVPEDHSPVVVAFGTERPAELGVAGPVDGSAAVYPPHGQAGGRGWHGRPLV